MLGDRGGEDDCRNDDGGGGGGGLRGDCGGLVVEGGKGGRSSW